MDIKAQLNFLHIAPRKARLVASLIRGMRVRPALDELRRMSMRPAAPLAKLLDSALASARHNFQLPDDDLYVKEVRVDEGTVLKRSRPRAFGRTAPIRKRTSHISLVLATIGIDRAGAPARVGARQEPVVRDATVEDVREGRGAETRIKSDREERLAPQMKKSKGFIRRVFQRKAI